MIGLDRNWVGDSGNDKESALGSNGLVDVGYRMITGGHSSALADFSQIVGTDRIGHDAVFFLVDQLGQFFPRSSK